MRYEKHSIDYEINIQAYREMIEVVPMTQRERNALKSWVFNGFELDSNPWDYFDEHGLPMNYLQAYRLRYGYSSGPWDFWRGCEYYCENSFFNTYELK